MRTKLLTFFLALFAVSAFGQGPVIRQPLTTNQGTFTSPSVGQVPKIHSVSGGSIVWTNAADSGSVGNLVENSFDTNALATYVFLPSMTAAQITNAVGVLPGNTLKWFTAGKYIIPTNTTSWMKPGVTNLYHFELGAEMYFGNAADNSGSVASPVPIFSDEFGAATLIVSGHGTFVSSNKSSPVLHANSEGSKVQFEALDLIRYNTNAQNAVIFQGASNDVTVICRDIINIGYDCYWNGIGAGSRIKLRARRLLAADTAVEAPTAFDYPWLNDIVVGSIEHYKQSYFLSSAAGNILLYLGDNVTVESAGGVLTGTNAYVLMTGGATTFQPPNWAFDLGFVSARNPATVKTPLIQADIFGLKTPVQGGVGRIMGATIVGPTNRNPVHITGPVYFDDVRVVSQGGATNSIGGDGSGVAHANGLTYDLPVGVSVVGISTRTNYLNVGESGANPPRPRTNSVEVFAKDDGSNKSRLYYKSDDDTVYGPLGAGSIAVREEDGTPNVTTVTEIRVTNGTLTDNGSGSVSVTTGGGGLISSVAANQFSVDSGNLTFKNGGTITNLVVQANVGSSSSLSMQTSEATDRLTLNGNTNGTAHFTIGGDEFVRFFSGGGSLWDSPHTNSSTMYLNLMHATGNVFTTGLTVTNGATNYGRYEGIGTNNAAIVLKGTNFGYIGWEAPTAGQTNLYKPNIISPTAGQMEIYDSIATAGATNLIARTNISTTGSGSVARANGASLGTFGSSTNANLNFEYVTNNTAYLLTTQLVATNSTVNSNLTMNVNVAALDLVITNNISVTNFSNLESGTSKTVTWHIYPTLVNRTVVWPTPGAPGNAVYWRTNANSPMWTTLTQGVMYVLSCEWRNTNCWASISEWK